MKEALTARILLEARIQAAYAAVPDFTRENIGAAYTWAVDTLMRLEGAGHEFYVVAAGEGLVQCFFAKVSWPSDHCGRGMEQASEAIVMAVCEYLNGA